jgi:ribulose-5-phosphate 4-epimerase/fuculose-1-phosphate aldolase
MRARELKDGLSKEEQMRTTSHAKATTKAVTRGPSKRQPAIAFQKEIAEQIVRYGRMVVARGYIHNSLGNIAIRVPHPSFPHGLAYTKHSGVSLEEMTIENVVITDVVTGDLVHGSIPTSVGHKLNREIFRLRSDVDAVIHVHHDETISFLGSGAFTEIKPVSLEYPYVMAKPAYIVPSHLDVEQDVGPLEEFIHLTNSLVMLRHGITTLGRNVSEAYHRLNTLTSEVRRNVMIETLCVLKGTKGDYLSQQDIEWMYGYAENVIYPTSQ